MTLLIIYSALSTLAALYCGAMAVKRWREANRLRTYAESWEEMYHGRSKQVREMYKDRRHAVEWLNAANDRVRELEESIVEEAKQTILKMRPDVKQVMFLVPGGPTKPSVYVDD